MGWVQWSLMMTLLSFCSSAYAFQIDAPEGSNVTLGCRYTISSANGYYDIEWSKRLPNIRDEDRPIIWLTKDKKLYTDLYKQMEGRVSFTSPDPRNKDASITIHNLRLSDTGTYVCSVRKSSKIFKRKVIVTVFEEMGTAVCTANDKPVCTVEGEPTMGKDVTLKCRSNVNWVRYAWKKTNGNQTLPSKAYVDTTSGDLVVKNFTEDDYGQYLCTMKCLISTKSCLVPLKNPLAPPSNGVESKMSPGSGAPTTVAAVTTAMLLLATVCAAVVIWYRRRRNRMYIPNETEEVAPSTSNWLTTKRAKALSQQSDRGHLFSDEGEAL
ncbi:coxsackievirus and adenovirus receptor homolog [Dunckerocampus dactyliophorus]|uniref:coxsackievirus and adenovirus receptor homolog n=1 Tax=Dunckerocampus dactyliophorus TaxID=161453 RepID=UPI002404F823|nr:coxsackievirus and adenovirus receptor homolog [Dunckerocampus dactyliophorus]